MLKSAALFLLLPDEYFFWTRVGTRRKNKGNPLNGKCATGINPPVTKYSRFTNNEKTAESPVTKNPFREGGGKSKNVAELLSSHRNACFGRVTGSIEHIRPSSEKGSLIFRIQQPLHNLPALQTLPTSML